MCGFRCAAAALCVLAAAGRLAAGLPVFPIHLHQRKQIHFFFLFILNNNNCTTGKKQLSCVTVSAMNY